jgi:hypothetical protein
MDDSICKETTTPGPEKRTVAAVAHLGPALVDTLPEHAEANLQGKGADDPMANDQGASQTGETRHLRSRATESESLWLGRLHCQGGQPSDAEGVPVRDLPAPVAAGSAGATRRGQSEGSAGVSMVYPIFIPSSLPFDQDEPMLSEADLLPLVWSSAHAPTAGGTLNMQALPLVAVPRLAATIVALRREETGGMIEVALSPDELGTVRLRLEIDAQDPDRMIIHLAFDRPDTLELFRRNADQLSEAIRAAGYAEAKLDFGQSGTDHAAPEDQGRSGRAANSGSEPRAATDSVAALAAANVHPQPAATAGLDLRV